MSKFVDQMSITDESGNIKKEININFGDPLAREQSQKAMLTSEQAKQTANEAKQIAQEAKDAVPGEVSQQVDKATQELSGEVAEAKQTADEAKEVAQNTDSNFVQFTGVMKKILPTVLALSEYGLIYKREAEKEFIFSTKKLVDDTAFLKNDKYINVVLKCDCAGVNAFQHLFGSSTDDDNRKTYKVKELNLYNVQPNYLFSYVFAHLENLEKVAFYGNINTSAVTNMNSLFYGCVKMTQIDLSMMDLSNVKEFSSTFANAGFQKEILFPPNMSQGEANIQAMFSGSSCKNVRLGFNSNTKISNAAVAFQNCYYLEDLRIEADFSNCKYITSMFDHCNKLTNFSGLNNLKKTCTLSDSPLLTHESALNCIAGLYDLTEGGTVTDYTAQTLIFHPDVTAQLTEEEIAEATAKGWNIA